MEFDLGIETNNLINYLYVNHLNQMTLFGKISE